MTQANQPPDPAARKAAAMAQLRLTDEQILAVDSPGREEGYLEHLYDQADEGLRAILLGYQHRLLDAQQAADFELLWPAIEAAREGLEAAVKKQAYVLERIKQHGFVFRNAPKQDVMALFPTLPEAEKWEHLAFALYTDLCEVAMLAGAAIDALDLGPEAAAGPGDGS